MASGAIPLESGATEAASVSPEPGKIQLHELLDVDPSELEAGRGSPRLSRKALDELGPENESQSDDPENYPLYTSWSFWFDRWAVNETAIALSPIARLVG